MWTENRYEAGEAFVFAGDFGVGGDFAVVCVNGRCRDVTDDEAPRHDETRRGGRAGQAPPLQWIRGIV